MQDKDKRTLDPALMDNAWLQMKQQLDQEMPQKKRRVIWWWTAGLAGLAILTLSIYLFATGTAPRPLEAEAVSAAEIIIADKTSDQEPSLALPEPGRSANNSIITKDQAEWVSGEGNSTLAAQKTMDASIPVAIPPFQETAIHEKPVAVENKIIRRADARPAPEVAAQTQSADVVVMNKIPTTDNEPSMSLETQDSGAKEQTKTDAFVIDQLPSPVSVRLPTSELKLPVKVTEVKPVSPWHYYLEGQGGLSLAQTDYNNFAVGLGVQRAIPARWSVALGLQYQRNQRVRKNIGSELAEEFSGSLGSGFAVERTLAFQNIETARWNIYLGGAYQLSPRFSLGIGVQGSYIAKAFAVFDNAQGLVAEPTAFDNDLRVDLYDSVLSVYDFDTVTNSVSNPYPLDANRWQWSLNSTARYRFGQRWEALVQYQRHLTGWPSREESFGGLSTLQAGLRYYLR